MEIVENHLNTNQYPFKKQWDSMEIIDFNEAFFMTTVLEEIFLWWKKEAERTMREREKHEKPKPKRIILINDSAPAHRAHTRSEILPPGSSILVPPSIGDANYICCISSILSVMTGLFCS